jgi:hypothetical protein
MENGTIGDNSSLFEGVDVVIGLGLKGSAFGDSSCCFGGVELRVNFSAVGGNLNCLRELDGGVIGSTFGWYCFGGSGFG